MMTTVLLVIILGLFLQMVRCQMNPAFTQNPANIVSGTNNVFYFDSASDCNGPIRELYTSTAIIKGNDASSSRVGLTTCTIRMRSTGQFETTQLDIEVKSMNIQDCTTSVSIFDGDGALQLMMAYDCRSNQNVNRKKFITSGNTVTFIMTRQNIQNNNFDIEILVTPIRGGIDPGDTNDIGSVYYFDKFPQTAIVGMIGAFYALVIVICTVIIIYCRRNYWGLNKQWETHQLATIKTGTSFDTKSLPSNVWSVEMKQNQGAVNQYPRGVTGLNTKKKDKPSEDDDSTVCYNDHAFQSRRLMNDDRDKSRPNYVSSNASYSEQEGSDHFEGKIVTSRVKRSKRPPAYKDVVSDDTSAHSSDEESEVSSSVNEHHPSSEEERSERSQTSRSERSQTSRSERSQTSRSERSQTSRSKAVTDSSEDSENEDDQSHRAGRTRSRKHKVSHQKHRKKDTGDVKQVLKPQGLHQQSLPPYAQSLPPYAQSLPPYAMQQVPYSVYPSGQFVPVIAGIPHYQPAPAVPSFPPPRYPASAGPQVQPTEPHIYNYLARRGYIPLDGHGNLSASSQGGQRSEGREPEMTLDSGVEYMSR